MSGTPARSSVAAGGTWQGLMLERSALRADCTALLGSGSRRRTHYASFARSVQTTAASQTTKRASRADPEPALLVAPEIAPARYPLPRVPPLSFAWEDNESLGGSAKARAGSRRRASAQPRSAGLVARARSALRYLTRRGCLNGAHEVSVVSSAARPWTEHRSAVAAQRRPPQHEPLPGTACRDARSSPDGDYPTTATGRQATNRWVGASLRPPSSASGRANPARRRRATAATAQ